MKLLTSMVVLLTVMGGAQAAMQNYYIVDYPAYQVDTVTGVTDQVSGTIVADPDTGVISSASFTLTGASGSYTIVSAIIDPDVYVHVSPTQITVDRNNPGNPLGYGYLGLRSSSPTTYPFGQLYWYLMGDPWVPGSMNYDAYHGEYKTGKTTVLVNFNAGTLGNSMVIAVVPEPATLGLLVWGVLCLARRR